MEPKSCAMAKTPVPGPAACFAVFSRAQADES
jgi:hypothetical protein